MLLDFEGSRRLKTEFLVQLDGAATCKDDRVLLVGATNRPQELDEAARRRLVKRKVSRDQPGNLYSAFSAGLYIPLPSAEARETLISHLMRDVSSDLGDVERMSLLVAKTKG